MCWNPAEMGGIAAAEWDQKGGGYQANWNIVKSNCIICSQVRVKIEIVYPKGNRCYLSLYEHQVKTKRSHIAAAIRAVGQWYEYTTLCQKMQFLNRNPSWPWAWLPGFLNMACTKDSACASDDATQVWDVTCWRYLLKHACPSTWKKPLKQLPKSQGILSNLIDIAYGPRREKTTLKICDVNYLFMVIHLQLQKFHPTILLYALSSATFVIIRLLPDFTTFVKSTSSLCPNSCRCLKEWYVGQVRKQIIVRARESFKTVTPDGVDLFWIVVAYFWPLDSPACRAQSVTIEPWCASHPFPTQAHDAKSRPPVKNVGLRGWTALNSNI